MLYKVTQPATSDDQGAAASEMVPHDAPQSLRDAADPAFEVAALADPFAEAAAFVETDFAAVLNFATALFVATPAFEAQAITHLDSTYWLIGSMIKSSKNVKNIKNDLILSKLNNDENILILKLPFNISLPIAITENQKIYIPTNNNKNKSSSYFFLISFLFSK